jgi:superfamily II DNA or RNA helicase
MLCEDVIAGRPLPGGKFISVHAVPGAGKTHCVSLSGHTLMGHGYVKQVIVVVPRVQLRSQIRRGFHNTAIGLNRKLMGDAKLIRGYQQGLFDEMLGGGLVTTYQALSNGRSGRRMVEALVELMLSTETALYLDEFHHLSHVADAELGESTGWVQAIDPLFEAAKLVVGLSGTLQRGENARIAYLRYDPATRLPEPDVTYTRSQGLAGGAIIHMEFEHLDGDVAYTYGEDLHEQTLSEVSKKESGRAVRAALASEWSEQALLNALGQFMSYRQEVYKSRAIVICATQEQARRMHALARDNFPVHAVLAISQDKSKAARELRDFAEGKVGEILVTVGMAYEGLDVPDATHLIYLSNITSQPWVEQAFNRVSRFNPDCGVPWEKQHARVFVPDTPELNVTIDKIRREQQDAFRDVKPGPHRVIHRNGERFKPISGEAGRRRYNGPDGPYSDEDCKRIADVVERLPFLEPLPYPQILQVANQVFPPPKVA